jgi:outer membrane protein OmpA-like peptidoglycan-associated protein
MGSSHSRATTSQMASQHAQQCRAEQPLRNTPKPAQSNQAVQRLLRSGLIQPKLTVNEPGDKFEREADRVAEVVAGMPGPGFRGDVPVGGQPSHSIQRMCSQCEEDLYRKTNGSSEARAEGALEAQINSLRGGGQPLSEAVRAYFEPRFAQDFRDVRIHTNSSAAETATSINALAYTRGSDVVFAPGQYRPDNPSGRQLIAHELAHVAQQRAGDAGVARKPAENMIQRACGPADIGAPAGCTRDNSEPVGDLALMRVNCDEYVSAPEEAKVIAFADSLETGDRVRVHGFASTDGNAAFNHNLSCARALRAVGTLTANGISPAQIDVLEHGPTPGPATLRRSVVLERVPGVSRPAVPQLTPVVTVAPTPGICGDMNFVITWVLSRNSSAVNGGFVIQDITFNWNVLDCTGAPVPNPDPRTSPLHYFEAWRAAPGTTALSPVATDTFFWPGAAPWGGGCTDGTVSITATARFHDNVAALPAHMVTPNPATFAGGLQSSVTDPALGGNVSRPVAHELSFHWTCCPCSSSPTVVDSHTP